MTKSTITRDQLRALAVKKVESLKFAITQSAFTNIRRGLEEELQLAEFALAAMDSEPVAAVPEDVRQALSKMDDEIIAELDAEESACRAAMLAAAPQSPGIEPVTVQGKWIPVSERMPEVGDIVLTGIGCGVTVGETECTATGFRFFTSVISGRELPATHWQPLPEPPQE